MVNKKILLVITIVIVTILVAVLYFLNSTSIDATKYGQNCSVEKVCGKLTGIDCQSNLDGPYYYVDKKTENIISTCGGVCMSGQCTNCPPKEWTCDVY